MKKNKMWELGSKLVDRDGLRYEVVDVDFTNSFGEKFIKLQDEDGYHAYVPKIDIDFYSHPDYGYNLYEEETNE